MTYPQRRVGLSVAPAQADFDIASVAGTIENSITKRPAARPRPQPEIGFDRRRGRASAFELRRTFASFLVRQHHPSPATRSHVLDRQIIPYPPGALAGATALVPRHELHLSDR
jgi:hypothetical protein